MRILKFFLLIFPLVILNQVAAEELYFRFPVENRAELLEITRLVSIDNYKNDTVYAFGTLAAYNRAKAAGYQIQLLEHPSKFADPKMAETRAEMNNWDVYPSYGNYVQMMYSFGALYPSICTTIVAGYSELGREILFVKISDNVHTEEAEPEVMYSSSMHGNELCGYVLMLRMIDSILTTYGRDPEMTEMVNNMEIWINPLANPDGAYRFGDASVSGAMRYNANFVDLNRNFPDPDEGPHPDGNSWQSETVAMMNIAEQQNWVISANFHGGAEVVNFPWDTWFARHPDDSWYTMVCRQYADSAQAYSPPGYMTQLDNGITNGWDWYPIFGGRQDYMNHYHGCREVTIELSNVKLLNEALLPAYWGYNRASLFDWFRQANFGITGIVTDYSTGDPIRATIAVIGIDSVWSEVYTDPDIGDYYRMLEPGTYSLRFSAEGYDTLVLTGITVLADSASVANVQLVPSYSWICGDIDNNGVFEGILELTYLVDFIFRGGPAPENELAADVDGSGGTANILDLTYMVDYIFRGGPEPSCQ